MIDVREFFAAQVLVELMRQPQHNFNAVGMLTEPKTPEEFAEVAYQVADAMIGAKNK